MIIIKQCRIDQEGKKLIIDACVDNRSYYDKVYIGSVSVNTEENFSPYGPTNEPIKEYNNMKAVQLCLSAKDLGVDNLNDHIFFVWIKSVGLPSPDTPCNLDKEYTMGIAVNLRPIYNNAMSYIKEIGDTCNIPRGLIDYILRLKAFDLSLRTGNYITAFKQWDKFFKNKVNMPVNKNCGCNGTGR